jgi:hypothetical protein
MLWVESTDIALAEGLHVIRLIRTVGAHGRSYTACPAIHRVWHWECLVAFWKISGFTWRLIHGVLKVEVSARLVVR